MRKAFLLFIIVITVGACQAQKTKQVENIYFNLYTDSLKKGFYNYINVDGKFTDGTWLPMDSTHVKFTANTGYFRGNDLFIDSSYKKDSIVVKAVLKSNPAIWKETTIYIRKRGFDEPLPTNEEIFNDMQNRRKKTKQRSALP